MDDFKDSKEKELLELYKRKQLCEKIIALRTEEINELNDKITSLCKEIYSP